MTAGSNLVKIIIVIPFNKPFMTGRELAYIQEAYESGHLSGDGSFSKRCHDWLEKRIGSARALLTHSCTGALEMAAILCDIRPGDEVILPSFSFASTANAFVLRGAVPVFVDVRADTLNLDERQVVTAISRKTKAIVPVHYAGVSCEMDALLATARERGIAVIEDAAQGILCRYKKRPLGSIGQLAALSFHETKNVISGEGGALLINDARFIERAEIIREKGTNRGSFFRGQAKQYTWVDVGSSYLPSDINAAFLWAQLERAEDITARRLAIWDRYHKGFLALEPEGLARRPVVPDHCVHNAHMYYLLVGDGIARDAAIEGLRQRGVYTVFHYVPLHSSPAGRKFGRAHGPMKNTDELSAKLIRLPLWIGLENDVDHVIEKVTSVLRDLRASAPKRRTLAGSRHVSRR